METETINLPLYASLHCEERVHCKVCRTDRAWRQQHVAFYGGKIDFDCALKPPVQWPDGFTPTDEVQPKLAPDRPQRPVIAAEPVGPEAQARKQAEHEAKEQAALPSAWERVVKGSIGLAKVALGVDRSPDALIESRKAICEACPHLEKGNCKLCGCRYRQKVKLASEQCPDNPPRW